MGILKVVFIILLLLFPLGQIARLEFQNGIAVTISDIAVGVVVLVFLFANRSKQRFKKSLTKPIIIFAVIGLLSLIVNIAVLNISEFIISSLYGIRWILYASIFFVVSGFDHEFKKIITKVMIFIGSFVVLVGYLQYFLYPNLRNLYYLGWDEHLYRMFSSFLDPNFAGAFFVLYFILILGMVFDLMQSKKSHQRHSGKRSAPRISNHSERFWTSQNDGKYINFGIDKLKVASFAGLGITTLIGVILTYSRGAYIMLLFGAITFLILKKQKKIAVGFIIVCLILIVSLSNFRIEGMNPLRIASTKARLESASHALVIIRNNPILGVGFNTYRYAQARHGFIKEDEKIVSHSAAGTDNSFLFVLATTGIVGLTFYLYMWFRILKSCHHDTKKESFQKTISIVIMASSIGLFANAFFINSLFYPSIMLWMWVLIGLNPSTGSGFKENR